VKRLHSEHAGVYIKAKNIHHSAMHCMMTDTSTTMCKTILLFKNPASNDWRDSKVFAEVTSWEPQRRLFIIFLSLVIEIIV
jgi:hypothetical protein